MTAQKKPTLGGALSALRSPAPTATPQPNAASSSQPSVASTTPIGVVVRFNPRDHRTVSNYADQLGMSIQELVETAINKMRSAEGLSVIEGRPRSKTRRRQA